jgi:acetyl esterase/lipase
MKLKLTHYLILLLLPISVLLFVSQTQKEDAQPPIVIPLWAKGAPGFEDRKNEPEKAKDWWVRNIHNPSITAYIPSKEKSTGTAVLICPGGGHQNLVFNAEGVDAALFFNNLGVTAFVLKYRLAREEKSPYTIEKHVRQDAYRAMRVIRSRASEWNIDPNRIGVMGFSAGGEVASLIAYSNGNGDMKAPDPIDRANGKPDFQILIYPGPGFLPDTIGKDAPVLFMLAANDDKCCSAPIINLLQKYREANIPVEAHLYAKGDHAFNMGNRSKLKSINTWPQRLADWMSDNDILKSTSK